MRRPAPPLRCAALAALLALPLAAQPLRDPTRPPAAPADPATAATAPALDLVKDADGSYRLLHEGRWLRVGQRLDGARITRITETEVWLSSDGRTRRIARHPGVGLRRTPATMPAASAPSQPPTGRPTP